MNNRKPPKSWTTRLLGNCGQWVSGGTPRKGEPSYWNGEIPWFSAKSLKAFDLDNAEDRVTTVGAQNGTTLVPPGTILFVVRGMSLANEFRVGVTSRESTLNQDLRGIISSDDVFPRYLGRFLKQSSEVMGKVDNASHGTKRIQTDKLKAIEIPLPPLSEQKRIAEILDKADAIRRKRQDTVQQAYELRRSQLLGFTGDAVNTHVRSHHYNTKINLPNGFRWTRLDELCEAICDIDHNMPKAVETGVPFLSPKDMPDDRELCFDDVKYISREDYERLSRKIKPRRNDIIYSRIGARLGKARLVRVDSEFLVSYSCCTIRVKEGVANPLYLTHYLDSIIARRQANLDTQSIAVPDLGLAKIKGFLVPSPSIEKQNEFAAQIDSIDTQIAKTAAALIDSNDLFNSLTQRAFRGKL